MLAHQAFLDVVEAVAELFDQRLEPVGGAEAEAGDEVGGLIGAWWVCCHCAMPRNSGMLSSEAMITLPFSSRG